MYGSAPEARLTRLGAARDTLGGQQRTCVEPTSFGCTRHCSRADCSAMAFEYGRTGTIVILGSFEVPAISATAAVQSSPSAISSSVMPSATMVSDMATAHEAAGRATTWLGRSRARAVHKGRAWAQHAARGSAPVDCRRASLGAGPCHVRDEGRGERIRAIRRATQMRTASCARTDRTLGPAPIAKALAACTPTRKMATVHMRLRIGRTTSRTPVFR